ncbi:MAG: protein kinase [Candidatus Krumholzibacteria bacterium]|nr:protein kinase [Candidatus Krumholzibacteria bacterium]
MIEKINLPGRYKILETLGSGVSGRVFRVHDSILNREVAVKLLLSADDITDETFKAEFKILADLDHTNLIKVHNFGFIQNDTPYYSMDYVEGKNIRDFFSDQKKYVYLHDILSSIFSAMEYLHEKDIIHADIKPENIMISETDENTPRPLLLDFGMAMMKSDIITKISGTPRYIAPEILEDHSYSIKSDLYALGITIAECLSGIDIPMAMNIDDDLRREISDSMISRLMESGIPSPSSLTSMIISLIQSDPGMRPENAGHCIRLIQDISKSSDTVPIIKSNVFIGRDDDMAFLEKFITPDSDDSNSILIDGSTGVGKRTIIDRISTHAQTLNLITINCSKTLSADGSLDVFIKLLGNNLFGDEKDRLLSSHEQIVQSLSLDEGPGSASTVDQSVIIFDNIVQFLHKLSEKQVILISIPDISSFDIYFIRFVSHLVYETDLLGSRVLIMISHGNDISVPALKKESLDQLMALPCLEQQTLAPLTKDQTKEFYEEMLGNELFTEREYGIIYDATRGLPLYLDKLLRHMIASNVIYHNNKSWLIDHNRFKTDSVSLSFTDMTSFDIDRFKPHEREVLLYFAYFNNPVSAETLSTVSDLSADIVKPSIDSMINDNILTDTGGVIDFISPSLRAQARVGASREEIVRINRSIASYLETNNPDSLRDIAAHYIEAESIKESLKFGLDAADRLITSLNFYEAYELLSSLYSLVSRSVDESNSDMVLERLVLTEKSIGLFTEVIEHYKILIPGTSDVKKKATYLKDMGYIYDLYLSKQKDGIKNYEKALTLAKEIEDNDLIAELMILMAGTEKMQDRSSLFEQAMALSNSTNNDLYVFALSNYIYFQKLAGNIDKLDSNIETLRDYLKREDLAPWARRSALHKLYAISFYNGDYDNAKKFMYSTIELSRSTSSSINIVHDLQKIGGFHYIQGEYFDMISTLNDALALSERLKMSAYSILTLLNLSSGYCALANYSFSLEYLGKAHTIASEKDAQDLHLTFYLKPLIIYVLLGDYFTGKIIEYSEKLKTGCDLEENSIMLGHRSLILSRFHFQKFDFVAAISNVKDAVTQFRKSDDRDDIVDALSNLTIYELEAGQIDKAAEHIKEARNIFDTINCNYLKPLLLFAEGSFARITNRDDAEDLLQKALKTSRKMGTREFTWQAQRELAILHHDLKDISSATMYYRDAIETIKQITESISDEEMKMSYLSLPFRKRVFDEIRALKQ